MTTQKEFLFMDFLKSKGLDVTYLQSNRFKIGNPDFLCRKGANSFYVEYKTNLRSLMSCSENQWRKFHELLEKGEKVFLAIETNYGTFFFELKNTWRQVLMDGAEANKN